MNSEQKKFKKKVAANKISKKWKKNKTKKQTPNKKIPTLEQFRRAYFKTFKRDFAQLNNMEINKKIEEYYYKKYPKKFN